MEATQTSWRSLGDLFVERGVISEADLERALAEQFATKRRLADILVRRGLVTGSDITSALNEQLAALRVPGGDAENEALIEVPADDHEDVDQPGADAPATPTLVPVDEFRSEPVGDATATEPASEDESAHEDESFGEQEPQPAPADVAVSFEPAAVIQENDARREAMESRLAALGPILKGIEQVHADLTAHDLCSPLLAHELTATQERLIARGDELSSEIAMLKETREEIERIAALLEDIRTELAGKIHELTELRSTAAIWTSRVADVEAEVESLTARANGAAGHLNALASTRVATPAIDAVTETHAPSGSGEEAAAPQYGEAAPARLADADGGHILFVPTNDGYELVEQVGAAPGVGTAVDVGGQSWVVTKVGRSPLPFDDRDCAFLTTSV